MKYKEVNYRVRNKKTLEEYSVIRVSDDGLFLAVHKGKYVFIDKEAMELGFMELLEK